MNRALKLVGICLGASLLIALTLMVVIQSQTVQRLQQENLSLKQRLDDLTAKADQLFAPNTGLLKLIPDQQEQAAPPLAQKQLAELLRLRSEVGRMRVELNQAEQANREQMQAAVAKLPNAEADLELARKLHSDRLISDADFQEAQFGVRVLKAEARGDRAEVAQVKWQQAEAEFADATELRAKSLISQTEYEKAGQKADSLKPAAAD